MKIIITHKVVGRVKLNHKIEDPNKRLTNRRILINVIGSIHKRYVI